MKRARRGQLWIDENDGEIALVLKDQVTGKSVLCHVSSHGLPHPDPRIVWRAPYGSFSNQRWRLLVDPPREEEK